MNIVDSFLRRSLYLILTKSLKEAANNNGLDELVVKLRQIVSDISEQYSSFKINDSYREVKTRNMHAFQLSLVHKVINEFQTPVIVDIGDSSGTHLQYIKELYSKDKDIKSLSINLDNKAVEKIKKKGIRAICVRAENLDMYKVDGDIFLCFEILEHLTDPCKFLHELSLNTNVKYLIITVPYVRKSRVGLHHIRNQRREIFNAENNHIFEFSPTDWKLIFQFGGWRVAFERVYLQYPTKHYLSITKFYWKKYDFEGFYGAILTRDYSWSDLYNDW